MKIRSKWFGGFASAVLLGLQLSLMGAGVDKEISPLVKRTLSAVGQLNPHLHGVESTITTAQKGFDKPEKVVDQAHHGAFKRWHSHWRVRWDYVTWISIHRGLGTVLGQVVDSRGQPIEFVQVNLRHWGGQTFLKRSAKHIVNTGADGNFIMRRVRAGAYRVAAKAEGQFGWAQVRVHVWQSSVANIRL